LDGVIVETIPLLRQVWMAFVGEQGITPSEDRIRSFYGRRGVDIVRELFGLPGPEAEDLAAICEARYQEQLMEAVLPTVPGIQPYLDALGALGVRRILTTSATEAAAQVILRRVGLEDCFDGMVTADLVRRGKPHPEPYLAAAMLAGAPPEGCLVVEDAVAGVRAATAAGSPCLGIATSETPETLLSHGARWCVPDFEQLPEALRLPGMMSGDEKVGGPSSR
jgi:sugar-phosphatase